jgi:hypothetical protein
VAFTLQQTANILKGTNLNQSVSFNEKIDASLKLFAGKIKKGDLIVSTLPQYTQFNPSDSQINEWCNRILDSSAMASRMMPSIISDPGLESDDINSSDLVINAACQWNIIAYSAKL